MVETIFSLLSSGLSLWQHKDKTKYADELIDLKKRWYEESNKADADRDDAVLDSIEFQLRILAIGFTADVGSANAATLP